MESQDQQDSSQRADGASNSISSAQEVMGEESGTSQDPRIQQQHMSTCTLQNLQQQQHSHSITMNEQNDLARPGSLADLSEEGRATKRLKVEGGGSSSHPSKPTLAKSVHIEGTSSLQGSKGKPSTSSSSDITPQAATTSVSEAGSSEQSLEAKHGASSSRPGSSAQLNATSDLTKPAHDTVSSAVTSSSATDTAASLKKAPLHSSGASKPQPEPPLPIKSLTMMHLHKKYTSELEYMLREFRKLERQLLGAKGNGVEENAGSRERREKLHSFILHLETTLEQIQLGVQLESEGKSTVMVGVTVGETAKSEEEVKQQLADSGALTLHLSKEKEEEENVQKLEEHILANLLPVKVRLKKQLAAQQGASRNPVGMPVARRGMLPSANADKGTGTFAAAAEQKRKQAEAAAAAGDGTQFGKPLARDASLLTQNLHGQTLGSSKRKYGHGVGSSEPSEPVAKRSSVEDNAPPVRKILYAGMAPGSTQLMSGVSAASGVHQMVIETPALYAQSDKALKATVPDPSPSATVIKPPSKPASALPQQARVPLPKTTDILNHSGQKIAAKNAQPLSKSAKPKQPKPHEDPNLTEEERKRSRKLRKRKKRQKIAAQRERERQLHILRQQQSLQASHAPKAATGKKGKMAANIQKKKGPHTVEYICSLCSEVYSSTCDCNPWWALTHHACPKCRKSQVPRIDISAPANAIEYHPALLAHAEEGGNNSSAGNGPGVMHINPSHIRSTATFPVNRRYAPLPRDSDSDSELSDLSYDGLSDDSLDSDFDDLDNLASMSPSEQAEIESFGIEYDGPKLTDDQTARLFILMSHASTCPGRHQNTEHRDVCSSVKFMMLHVRDCPGTTGSYDVCPFPWCRKVKHSLYHLVSCSQPEKCSICSSQELSPNIKALVGLNEHRRQKQRERRTAAMAAAAAAAKAKSPPRAVAKSKATTGPKSAHRPSTANASAVRKAPSRLAPPSHLKTVPAAPAPASAVAIAAAAAAAKVAATTAALPPAKPTQKTAVQPKAVAPAGTSTKAPSVADVPLATASEVGGSVGVPENTASASFNKPTASTAHSIMPTAAPTGTNSHAAVPSQPESAIAKPVAAIAPSDSQPLILTTTNVTKETQPTVVTPESPSTVPTKSESECRFESNIQMEDTSPDKTAANAPSTMAVPGAAGQIVNAEEAPVGTITNAAETETYHSEGHDVSNCPDECCLGSKAAVEKVKTEVCPNVTEALEMSTTEGKSKTPPSRSLSYCSDEATRKGDAVETISSC